MRLLLARARSLLALVALLAAGCTAPSLGGAKEVTVTFERGPKGAISSVHSSDLAIHSKGDIVVTATSAGGPVLVVLQEKRHCGSFADDHSIASSRYESDNVSFSYSVRATGNYCLSFSNHNAAAIGVVARIRLPG
jgi:hypothetical protein